jgi:hypothetical protein
VKLRLGLRVLVVVLVVVQFECGRGFRRVHVGGIGLGVGPPAPARTVMGGCEGEEWEQGEEEHVEVHLVLSVYADWCCWFLETVWRDDGQRVAPVLRITRCSDYRSLSWR